MSHNTRVLLDEIWLLARPYNAVLPSIGVAIGWFSAGGGGSRLVLLAMGVYALLHSGLTIWNDIEDESIDDMPGRHSLHTIRAIGARRKLAVATGVLIVGGLLLSAILGWSALFWGWALVICGYVYNARPLQASRRPLASIGVLSLCYGAIPILLGASYAGQTPLSLSLALGYLLLRGSLSILKDYKDAPSDAKHNKRTFLLVYGGRWVARVSITAAGVGFALVITAVLLQDDSSPWWLVLVVVAGWLLTRRWQLKTAQSYPKLNKIFHECLHYQLVFDGLILLWLASRTT